MSRARFSADAEADLLAIVEFIAQDNPNAAREWLGLIRERCELLAQHPLTGESRPKISRSGLELFHDCPRCFYFDKRLGLSRPPTSLTRRCGFG